MTVDEVNALVDGIMAGLKDRFDHLSARLAVLEQRADLRELPEIDAVIRTEFDRTMGGL